MIAKKKVKLANRIYPRVAHRKKNVVMYLYTTTAVDRYLRLEAKKYNLTYSAYFTRLMLAHKLGLIQGFNPLEPLKL